MAELIKASELKNRLKKIPEWELEKKHIERTFEFDEFSEAIDFVNSVAEVAEDEEHHPDIDIRFNKVRLILSTHSKGGLTDLDLQPRGTDRHPFGITTMAQAEAARPPRGRMIVSALLVAVVVVIDLGRDRLPAKAAAATEQDRRAGEISETGHAEACRSGGTRFRASKLRVGPAPILRAARPALRRRR